MGSRTLLGCEDASRPAVEALLGSAGLNADFHARLLPGGANNKVFHLQAGAAEVLLKQYFQDPGDARNRLAAEFAFCRFAWTGEGARVPKPLACRPEASMALYEYISGRRLAAAEVDEAAVAEALDFYETINRSRHSPAAAALPTASEACFSVPEHLRCVNERVARLTQIDDASEIGAAARAFVREQLAPAWEELRSRTEDVAKESGLLGRMPKSDERLSPSDFGFHNAIKTGEGPLRFIDFEYAGWDDPAKLVCDFFCQPAVPVPESCFEAVAARVAGDLSAPQLHVRRIRMLLPVYRMKWCCIFLNEFLKTGGRRRQFSSGGGAVETKQAAQLEKAKEGLTRLQARTSSTWRSGSG